MKKILQPEADAGWIVRKMSVGGTLKGGTV